MNVAAVFVPASDDLLNSLAPSEASFVPFQTDYLVPTKDRKPRNWITPSTYEDAMARLRALSKKPTVSE